MSLLASLLVRPSFTPPGAGDGCTPLDLAGWSAAPRSVLDSLVALGGRARGVNKQGDSLLHYAVRTSDFELCKTLVQLGSELNAVNMRGEAPLLLAITRGDLQTTARIVPDVAGAVVDLPRIPLSEVTVKLCH